MPSGWLGILPLGLAQDPASKRRFIDDYEIVYAPSLEALAAAHDAAGKSGPATLAAIVNPTGDLPGTEKEGEIVASHFASAARIVLQGAAATPEAVLAALKGKTHWHFASHGAFSWEDAREFRALMHDAAPLTVGRLLETDGLGRPRLVVLSACETGLYDIRSSPDEFVGLARHLHRARGRRRARHLVAGVGRGNGAADRQVLRAASGRRAPVRPRRCGARRRGCAEQPATTSRPMRRWRPRGAGSSAAGSPRSRKI